uniref:Oxysterol-binding protein-related protein 8 n=1 Tax=Lygus hesperus TaxID=30085 RepID=A0A0A9XY12_LYGHE
MPFSVKTRGNTDMDVTEVAMVGNTKIEKMKRCDAQGRLLITLMRLLTTLLSFLCSQMTCRTDIDACVDSKHVSKYKRCRIDNDNEDDNNQHKDGAIDRNSENQKHCELSSNSSHADIMTSMLSSILNAMMH